MKPSPAGHNGRDRFGRFARGNKLGRGNPLNQHAQRLRAAMLRAVTAGDVREIVAAMIDKATTGDVQAATLVLNYTVGKPASQDSMTPAQVFAERELVARVLLQTVTPLLEPNDCARVAAALRRIAP